MLRREHNITKSDFTKIALWLNSVSQFFLKLFLPVLLGKLMLLLGEEYLKAKAFRVARGQDGLASLIELVEMSKVL